MNSITTISSKTGGRLGNQLYFILQAYCIGKRNNIDCKYVHCQTIAPYTDMLLYKDILNLSNYLSEIAENNSFLELSKYYQHINEDFSEEELNGFINSTIMQCDYIKNCRLQDDCIALHIRNGDYLNLPFHNCFDRKEYLINAFQYIKTNTSDISTLKVYSDDNLLNMKEYDLLFKSYFNKVEYISNANMIYDFLELCIYKYKIIWNSTFDYWSSFVADLLFKNLNIVICPNINNIHESIININKKTWKII